MSEHDLKKTRIAREWKRVRSIIVWVYEPWMRNGIRFVRRRSLFFIEIDLMCKVLVIQLNW
jgi:hypothetical protein